MKKAKNLHKKLIVMLLTMAMVFTSIPQNMLVYAAEADAVLSEAGESQASGSENAVTDDNGSGNKESDEAASGEETSEGGASGNEGTGETGSGNEGTGETGSGNEGTGDNGSGNEGTGETGSGDEGTGDNGSGSEGTGENTSGNEGTGENGETEEGSGTEDGDTENPEDPDAEDGDSEELGDAEADENLEEVKDEAVKLAAVREAKVRGTRDVSVDGFASVGGWNESIYAEIAGIEDTDVVEVEYSGQTSGKLSANKVHQSNETDLDYLVRKVDGNVRIDIPGLSAGTYTLKVTVGKNKTVLEKSGIKVYAHDRSGYAHFKYTEGVGAYNDDGTLKDNAIVIYVTDDTKNSVVLKDEKTGTTVTGIGNILNTVGKSCGESGHENECKKVYEGKSYYAKANTNQDILKKLADNNRPLVVRFIGTVSDSGEYKATSIKAANKGLIDGLTIYAKTDTVNENGTKVGSSKSSDGNRGLADYGGTGGDNGHMARMKSGKDITLEGIGYDAVIDGWGFHFMCESSNTSLGKSFEARNLTFINTPEDAIGMEGVQEGGQITASVDRCWVHNNEFYCPHIDDPAENDKAQGDGSVDFKRGQYFTCSYNYYEGCHKTNLIGSADSSLQFNLTYHHNYNRSCESRGPLARQANIHMYNNIYDFQSSYAMNPRADAYIFSEYNMFYRTKNPMEIKKGAIKSYNDTFSSCSGAMGGTIVTDKNQKVSNNCKYLTTDLSSFDTDSNLSYIPGNTYKLDKDFTDLRKVITFETGVQDRYPKRADDESISPAEYSVMLEGTTVHQIDNLPYTQTSPQIIKKSVYAFSINGTVDLTVQYSAEPGGVLINEAGENLLQGSGTYVGLEAGTYIIQSVGTDADPSYNAFKDMTINSLEIKANDPNAHYHKWVEDSTKSTDPTCTTAGSKVYRCTADNCTEENSEKTESVPALGHDFSVTLAATKEPTCTEPGNGTFKCSRCDETTTGPVPALGHKWGSWTTTTPATESTKGEEKRACTICSQEETREIPAGGTSGGDASDDVVFDGDYVLTFEGGKANGDTDFFTLNNLLSDSFVDVAKGPTVNGTKYKGSLKLKKTTSIEFTCDDDSILFIVCATDQSNKKIKLNGTTHYTKTDATLTIDLKVGTYTITKDSEPNICYLAVASKSSKVYHTLSFLYNYTDTDEDEPEEKTMSVADGQKFASMEALVPSSFTRSGYTLEGLYEDAACTKAIDYPYTVNKDADFYAKWKENDDTTTEKSHTLYIDANNNTSKRAVTITESLVYELTEKPTRTGYVFAGWYDAKEGGNLVSVIDGRTMTEDMTVYAHWNSLVAEGSLSLDCAKDLTAGDITSNKEIKGFTIHALAGGGGASQDSPKYYMTVKDKNGSQLLYTNGMLLEDTTITGNEKGLLKTIEFTASGAGVLTVSVAGSGNFTPTNKPARNCQIAIGKLGSDGKLTKISSHQVTSEKVSPVEFNIDAAGTYYIYAEKVDDNSMGVVYSSIKFEQPQYTILYEPGVAASGDFASVTAKVGDEISLPAYTAKPGYTVKGWALEDTETVLTSYTVKAEDAVDGIITFVALYEADKYAIEFKANGGEMDSADETDVKAGTEIPLPTPIPPENKIFAGWTIVTGESKITLTGKTYTVRGEDAVNGKITLTAEYKKVGEELEPSHKGIAIVGLETSYEFTGAKIIPDIGVVDYDIGDGKVLQPKVDYTVKYKDNTKVGEATITITGKGNYAGKDIKQKFKIVAAANATGTLVSLKGAKLEKIAVQQYRGEAIYPNFKLKLKTDTAAKEYKYNTTTKLYESGGTPIAANVAVSNNVNKGTATILITGDKDGNKETKIKKTFKITAIDLAKNSSKVKVDATAGTYSVKGAQPGSITVTYDGKTLINGTDYTAKYSNNKKGGATAKITITGKGNYAKKATGNYTYTVGKLNMSELKVSAVTAYKDMKAGKVKATVVDKKGNILKPAQYTLKIYKNPEGEGDDANAVYGANDKLPKGKIYVAAEAKDKTNLDGNTGRAEFDVGTNIAKAKVVLRKDNNNKALTKEYTGQEVTLDGKKDITVNIKGATGSLVEGTHFVIAEYYNNINKGTATAVIKGINDYSGTKTFKFKIVGKNIAIEEKVDWTDIPDTIKSFIKKWMD